jgi:hypothetical protein
MLHKIYTSELHQALGGYLATWLPTLRLHLGDIMEAGENGLTRVGSLADHNVGYRQHSTPKRALLEYSSAGAVAVTTKLAGQATVNSNLAETEAGIAVRFSRANAMLFEAADCGSLVIADIAAVGRMIQKKYEEGTWQRRWLVITELVTAGATTVLISTSASAGVDFKAGGTLSSGTLRLSDAHAKLQAGHISDIGLKIIAAEGLTPLYRASGIKESWLTGEVRFRGQGSGGERRPADTFAPLTPEDILPEPPGVPNPYPIK